MHDTTYQRVSDFIGYRFDQKILEHLYQSKRSRSYGNYKIKCHDIDNKIITIRKTRTNQLLGIFKIIR